MQVVGCTIAELVRAANSELSDLRMMGYRFGPPLSTGETVEWFMSRDGVVLARVKIEPGVNGAWLSCQGISVTPWPTPTNYDYAKATGDSTQCAENLRKAIIRKVRKLSGDKGAEQEPPGAQPQAPTEAQKEQEPPQSQPPAEVGAAQGAQPATLGVVRPREPSGRSRLACNEWARTEVHVNGKDSWKDVFPEWCRRHEAETGTATSDLADSKDSFRHMLKTPPK